MESKLPPSFKASKLSREDVRARLRLADQPKASMAGDEPIGAQFVLNVMEILPYDKNPRQAVYDDFADLKESIRKQGFQGAFPVTRRPDQKAFMLAQGYNQRLKAVQELWQETGDTRYRDVAAVYAQWTSESDNLARHLSENLTRSDMTFWDKATGFQAFKAMREAETGTILSLRKLEDEAKRGGLQVSITALSFFLFASQRLLGLRSELLDELKYDDVIAIQPGVNRLSALSRTFGIDDRHFESRVMRSAVESANVHFVSHGWSARSFLDACERALAELLGREPAEIPAMLALLERFPSLSRDELVQAVTKPLPPSPVKENKRSGPTDAASTVAEPPNKCAEEAANLRSRDKPTDSPTHNLAAALDGFVSPARFPALDIERESEASTAPDAGATDVETLLDQIWFIVERLAEATEVADLIRRAPALPAGFYIEVQAADEASLDFDGRAHRHTGWWMLAAVSGQMNRAVSARLPEDSVWRRAHQDQDPDLPLSFVVQERLGMFCYLPPVAAWLADPDHPIGDAYFALLGLLRALRQTASARFPEPDSP